MEEFRHETSPPPPPPIDVASSLDSWDWSGLLDFSPSADIGDPFFLFSPAPDLHNPIRSPTPLPRLQPPAAPAESSARVRKRDPRLACENYLAGRVPCSCPEADEAAAAAADGADDGGRKRPRLARIARCQVPSCEADICELKGYHRRHRVCLSCANAPHVLLEGENKRYCQQCGKFHILSDFDEGKRSCRRKLERHNKRRRRRSFCLKDFATDGEGSKEDLLDDTNSDVEAQKGSECEAVETVVSNTARDGETILASENCHGSPLSYIPCLQNNNSSSGVSFASSGNAQIDGGGNPKSAISSTNRSVYSSVCPTGRISFKLYDWNPAEFPRRLRHQIFQWLANMPVELESYIRPGCTILTIFIAMPQFMWDKLSQELVHYIQKLVNASDSLFIGRGNFLINLCNVIIRVMRDGTSLMNIKMEVQAPKLHYVYPAYFEAGKSMEFVACGSYLDQPKFRFLVSFAGKYLVYDSCCIISKRNSMPYDGSRNGSVHSEHEIIRISMKQTDPSMFGPAFIEVENVSGISNFIPVIFGSKHVCSELQRIERSFCRSVCEDDVSGSAISDPSPRLCSFYVSKQTTMSEFLLDIAWLLKKPVIGERGMNMDSHNVERLTVLLEYLIENGSVVILEEILHYFGKQIDWQVDNGPGEEMDDANLLNFRWKVHHGREVCGRVQHERNLGLDSSCVIGRSGTSQDHRRDDEFCIGYFNGRDGDIQDDYASTSLVPQSNDKNTSLVIGSTYHRRHFFLHEFQDHHFCSLITRTHPALFASIFVVVCLSACFLIAHPKRLQGFMTTLTCLLDGLTL